MPATSALPRFVKLGFNGKRAEGEPTARFVNRMAQLAGLDPFITWPIIAEPCHGCVVTNRAGEAGFLYAINPDTYWVADGGNMKPRPRSSIVAFRWPKGEPITTHPLRHNGGIAR